MSCVHVLPRQSLSSRSHKLGESEATGSAKVKREFLRQPRVIVRAVVNVASVVAGQPLEQLLRTRDYVRMKIVPAPATVRDPPAQEFAVSKKPCFEFLDWDADEASGLSRILERLQMLPERFLAV